MRSVVSKGNYGLMQIRLGTAKAMGYRGTADGLLDADTNMTYAVKYLASAYRAAGCNEQRAINYYQRGFYKRPTAKCALPRSTHADRQRRARASPAAKRSMTDAIRCAGLGRRAAAAGGAGADDRPAEVRHGRSRRAPAQRCGRAGIRSRCCGAACCTGTPLPLPRVVQPAVAAACRAANGGKGTRAGFVFAAAAKLSGASHRVHGTAADAEAASGQGAAGGGEARSSDGRACVATTRRASPDVRWQETRMSAAVPLPQPKPEIEAAPERESKRARRAPQRHTYTRVSRKKPAGVGPRDFFEETHDA